jgi:hypothetical protein
MILASVVIKAYVIMTFMTVANEAWNINNPRPYPKGIYASVNWNANDFYYRKNGEAILRYEVIGEDKHKAEARRLWHEHKVKRIR